MFPIIKMNSGTNYEVKNKVLYMSRIYSVPFKSYKVYTSLLYFSLTIRLFNGIYFLKQPLALCLASEFVKRVISMFFHWIQLNSWIFINLCIGTMLNTVRKRKMCRMLDYAEMSGLFHGVFLGKIVAWTQNFLIFCFHSPKHGF